MKEHWHRWVGWLDSPIVDRVVRLAAILSLVGLLVVTAEQHQQEQCQKRYAEAAARAAIERADAFEKDLGTFDTLVDNLLDGTPGTGRLTLEQFREARREADAQRAANPPAAPPSEFCSKE